MITRWGDQQWWPRPIAMFGTGNISRDIFLYEVREGEEGGKVKA